MINKNQGANKQVVDMKNIQSKLRHGHLGFQSTTKL
jgi:hypothetical protein